MGGHLFQGDHKPWHLGNAVSQDAPCLQTVASGEYCFPRCPLFANCGILGVLFSKMPLMCEQRIPFSLSLLALIHVWPQFALFEMQLAKFNAYRPESTLYILKPLPHPGCSYLHGIIRAHQVGWELHRACCTHPWNCWNSNHTLMRVGGDHVCCSPRPRLRRINAVGVGFFLKPTEYSSSHLVRDISIGASIERLLNTCSSESTNLPSYTETSIGYCTHLPPHGSTWTDRQQSDLHCIWHILLRVICLLSIAYLSVAHIFLNIPPGPWEPGEIIV